MLGIKFTIDLTGSTPAVTDVKVENGTTGQYEPLDDSKTYIVGGRDYISK